MPNEVDLSVIRSKLREPLAEVAVKRPAPQEEGKKLSKRNLLSSINPAYVVERLNDVFGENGWFADYVIIENSPQSPMVVVRCDFKVPTLGIERHCFGGNDNSDRGDAYKGACSDALGKVASQIGIASDVYKGIHDRQMEAESRRPRKKNEKEQFGSIDGIVNRYEQLSPSTVWLMVDQTKCRAISEHIIHALGKCLGKRVELRCRWDRVGTAKKENVMTILTVLGVFDPVPSAPSYERVQSKCHKHGIYDGEGNCPKCDAE